MPEPTPEAWAQIRQAYEHTDKPLAHICAEHDISIPTLRYRMKVWQWRRRKPLIPREGPPPVDVFSPPPVRAANGGEGARVGGYCEPETLPPTPPAFADASAGDPPHRFAGGGLKQDVPNDAPATIVPRLQSAVARVLPAIEAIIARLAAGASPREMEQAGRTLSSLTRTLRELNALLAQHNAGAAADDDMPEDMDAFRLELARRIDAFVASRTAEEHLA